MNETTIRAAETIGELDLHMSYMRSDISKLVDAVANMATKQDIRELEDRMQGFATKAELEAVEKRLSADSLQSTFDRWLSLITRLGTAAAVLGAAAAAVAAVVHFVDRVPK
jgi:hypothetical protein